ncbi:hypothetical protein CLQ_13873 (plasmid) [Clostridium botulinum Af84]|uniref:hypothetical protein n=1 Tax=Clostridium botulinum TaxID=1491 RepID=UPI00035BA523|nr:hypothetical protein [Clostridium botulinum]APR02598.1 hypothetical protein RSJ2_3636 [Clostridium botulinum]AUN19695.1 hypothetical protein B2M06_19235 [Clostridium botulinum]EPS54380.1 hypothetical protein CLQ_13873 [Clostridium botulinum Af84]NFP09998.1 hypothetical protein [Clostridium botulinum]NFR28499.1 hypothetical protein [Clostridium botulinum]
MNYNNYQIAQYNQIMHDILDLNITCELRENLRKREIKIEQRCQTIGNIIDIIIHLFSLGLTIKEALIITNGNYYWLNFVLLFLSSCFNTLIIINFWSSFDERIIAEFISNIIIKNKKYIRISNLDNDEIIFSIKELLIEKDPLFKHIFDLLDVCKSSIYSHDSSNKELLLELNETYRILNDYISVIKINEEKEKQMKKDSKNNSSLIMLKDKNTYNKELLDQYKKL